MPPPPGTHEPVGSAMVTRTGSLRIVRKPSVDAVIVPAAARDAQGEDIAAWLTQYAQALTPKRVAQPLVLTDGGLRKVWGDIDFFGAIGGLTLTQGKTQPGTHEPVGAPQLGGDGIPPTLRLVGPLRRTRPIVLDDAVFLQKTASAIFGKPIIKQMMPAPTMLHRYLQRDASFMKVYPSVGAFFRDLTTVYAGELRDLANVGVTYVQLNDDNLPMLCEGYRSELGKVQVSGFAELINQLAAAMPPRMMIALHLRRDVSQPLPDMAAVLKQLVAALKVPVVMVDYERPTADDFAWLSALKPPQRAVLGLINGENEALEPVADVLAALKLAMGQMPKQKPPQKYLHLGIHGEGVALKVWVEKLVLGERVASEFWRHA